MKIDISNNKVLDIDFDHDFKFWVFPISIMYDSDYKTLAIVFLCFAVEFEIMNRYN